MLSRRGKELLTSAGSGSCTAACVEKLDFGTPSVLCGTPRLPARSRWSCRFAGSSRPRLPCTSWCTSPASSVSRLPSSRASLDCHRTSYPWFWVASKKTLQLTPWEIRVQAKTHLTGKTLCLCLFQKRLGYHLSASRIDLAESFWRPSPDIWLQRGAERSGGDLAGTFE